MFLLGTFMEFSTNTSFFWPCWSQFTIRLQSSYMIAFYWMMFNETETARYIVMGAIYASKLVTIFEAQGCGLISKPEINANIGNIRSTKFLHKHYNFDFHIRGLATTIEVFQDYYTVINLWRAGNLFEFGYFLGKAIVNVVFFGLSIVVNIIYWSQNELKTVDDDVSNDGDSLSLFAF